MGFKFEDLQPHVEMLCDALANRGSSSSGMPHEALPVSAEKYRVLLDAVRKKQLTMDQLNSKLHELNKDTLMTVNTHRIRNLVEALEIYFRKELLK
jgi:hypothetical protein